MKIIKRLRNLSAVIVGMAVWDGSSWEYILIGVAWKIMCIILASLGLSRFRP